MSSEIPVVPARPKRRQTGYSIGNSRENEKIKSSEEDVNDDDRGQFSQPTIPKIPKNRPQRRSTRDVLETSVSYDEAGTTESVTNSSSEKDLGAVENDVLCQRVEDASISTTESRSSIELYNDVEENQLANENERLLKGVANKGELTTEELPGDENIELSENTSTMQDQKVYKKRVQLQDALSVSESAEEIVENSEHYTAEKPDNEPFSNIHQKVREEMDYTDTESNKLSVKDSDLLAEPSAKETKRKGQADTFRENIEQEETENSIHVQAVSQKQAVNLKLDSEEELHCDSTGIGKPIEQNEKTMIEQNTSEQKPSNVHANNVLSEPVSSIKLVDKRNPPPVPKKPSSRIAAFQQMLQQQQGQHQEFAARREVSDSDRPSPDHNRAQFAQNLNGMFGMPGMMGNASQLPPALAKKLGVVQETSSSNTQDEEEIAEAKSPQPKKNRGRRSKGPQKRLPTKVSNVEKVEAKSVFEISVSKTWSISFKPSLIATSDIGENGPSAAVERLNLEQNQECELKESDSSSISTEIPSAEEREEAPERDSDSVVQTVNSSSESFEREYHSPRLQTEDMGEKQLLEVESYQSNDNYDYMEDTYAEYEKDTIPEESKE